MYSMQTQIAVADFPERPKLMPTLSYPQPLYLQLLLHSSQIQYLADPGCEYYLSKKSSVQLSNSGFNLFSLSALAGTPGVLLALL